MNYPPAKPPRQLPLDLVHPVAHGREDLLIGPSNREAVALVERWPAWPSPVVVLAGPSGCGKTHLAAIWREETGAFEIRPDRLRDAVDRAARGPVLIDDVDASPIDETGMFHLLNTIRQHGSSLLLTARRFPMAWGVRLPDLESRLRVASIVEIHEPDDTLLAGVLTKLFADRQVDVELSVIQFLVRRIERSLSAANTVVDRLDRAALEQKTRISRALAAQVVAQMESGQASLEL